MAGHRLLRHRREKRACIHPKHDTRTGKQNGILCRHQKKKRPPWKRISSFGRKRNEFGRFFQRIQILHKYTQKHGHPAALHTERPTRRTCDKNAARKHISGSACRLARTSAQGILHAENGRRLRPEDVDHETGRFRPR